MANEIFKEYATSTAFLIQLSKNQCNALLRLKDLKPVERVDLDGHKYTTINWPFHNVGTYKCLEARGLVYWHRRDNGEACGFGGLTKAGEIMVALLEEAGLTIESTNTASILKKIECAA